MKKRFFAIFIVVIMLLSQMTIFASALDSNSTVTNPQDKLTDELKEVMSDTADDEYIPISIWLYEADDSYVYSAVSEHYGVEINQNNENEFLQKQVDEKASEFYSIKSNNEITAQAKELTIQTNEQISNEVNSIRNNSIVNDTISDDDLKEFIKSGKDISEIITSSEQNAYTKEWRSARKNINSRINASFENSLNLSKCKNVCVDSMIGYATLEAKKSYILTIASLLLVMKIDYLEKENIEFVNFSDGGESENVIGYHMNQDDIPIGYSGAGVKIGVVELAEKNGERYNVMYDTNNVHLANKSGKIYTNYTFGFTNDQITDVPNDHATYVLTMLCGNPVSSTTGEVYRGIAPNATVYYTAIIPPEEEFNNDLRNALEWLIDDSNVSVVNLSFGTSYETAYLDLDQYVDCLIKQYRVVFVIAAGNENQYISSPGKAYNAITVGCMTPEKNSANQYIIWDRSNHNESDTIANKPDIMAFGTNIYTLNTSFEPICYPDGGTSLSSPMVAGTIALMIERNPTLANKPDRIKAILLTSANNEEINARDISDEQRCPTPIQSSSYIDADGVMRDKTGAGILNIIAAVEYASNAVAMSYVFDKETIVTTGEYFITSGSDFKIGLVFEKADHDIPNSDEPHRTIVNFEMIDVNTGTVVLSSESAVDRYYLSIYDNVKIFDVSTKVSGTYVFRISLETFDETDSSGTTKPSVHKNSHAKLNATLAITCSCLNPITSSGNINYIENTTATMHSCNNIGCIYVAIGEIEYHETLLKNESFGIVNHSVTHKRSYSEGAIIIDENISVSVQLNDPTKTYRISRGAVQIQYNEYGYVKCNNYELYIFNSDGSMYDILTTSVYVQYDNVTARIFLHP